MGVVWNVSWKGSLSSLFYFNEYLHKWQSIPFSFSLLPVAFPFPLPPPLFSTSSVGGVIKTWLPFCITMAIVLVIIAVAVGIPHAVKQ